MSYQADLKFTREVRDTHLKPKLYDALGQAVFVDGDNDLERALQFRSCDTILILPDGTRRRIEEKATRFGGIYYDAVPCEVSRIGPEGERIDSWMRTCRADILLFAALRQYDIEIYMLDWPVFQAWFLEHCERMRGWFRHRDPPYPICCNVKTDLILTTPGLLIPEGYRRLPVDPSDAHFADHFRYWGAPRIARWEAPARQEEPAQ